MGDRDQGGLGQAEGGGVADERGNLALVSLTGGGRHSEA
jgi:hypothetical protein